MDMFKQVMDIGSSLTLASWELIQSRTLPEGWTLKKSDNFDFEDLFLALKDRILLVSSEEEHLQIPLLHKVPELYTSLTEYYFSDKEDKEVRRYLAMMTYMHTVQYGFIEENGDLKAYGHNAIMQWDKLIEGRDIKPFTIDAVAASRFSRQLMGPEQLFYITDYETLKRL